ncbi:MAG: putative monovalent cation/H+ antiporter subunit A [Cryomorphaceae bacterium]|nr:MAG: putative monovalent cation/H+ antiporter subunit A [Cryomorphaceae bacterium]
MLTAVLSGFVMALVFGWAGRWMRSTAWTLTGLFPTALFIYFLTFLPVAGGDGVLFSNSWVPSIGVNLDFRMDGLALLFSLMISGIGALVFFYSSNYLKGHAHLHRFYGYLSMFMASMLGLVLSDNLLSMFVFWELTSISSFFLIGFNNNDPASRKSSMIALAITGGGGLMLMVGILLMGYLGGSFSIVELLHQTDVLRSGALYGWIIFFVFVGAFSKSAQFPLHFWLPAAMKAPTPVSTYLHSATMVKAGVYLLARLTPVLGDEVYWNVTLVSVGALTMVYAAIHALFRTDMKSILAYSTISALGIMVFLIGIGSRESLLALSVFILVHALYKAALFLLTGIVDHETGTRDVTQLAGLRRVLLPVALAGLLAALSNAGFPPTFGFLGKDLIYEATLNVRDWDWLLTALAVVTNICLLWAGWVVGVKPFVGKLPESFENVHLPSPLLWVPPLLLAVLGLLFGLFPVLISEAFVGKIHQSVYAASLGIPGLKLWHGFNMVLLLSAVTVVSGFVFYVLVKPSKRWESMLKRLKYFAPEQIITFLWQSFERFSSKYTNILQYGLLRFYLMIILLFLITMLGYKFFTGVELRFDPRLFTGITIYEGVIVALMFISIFLVVFSRSRLHAVVAMGVVGYSLCLLFMDFGAPDLAMTQFTIDTLTVVLFVLVLYNLPKYLNYSNPPARFRDSLIGATFGLIITLLALEVIQEPLNRETSKFYADNAYLLAKGKNVVNVILVDFRGIDTLGEIIVLTVAALGVFSLIRLQIVTKKNKS